FGCSRARDGPGDFAFFVLRYLRPDRRLGDKRQRRPAHEQRRSDAIYITHVCISSSFLGPSVPGGAVCPGTAEQRLNMNGGCTSRSCPPRSPQSPWNRFRYSLSGDRIIDVAPLLSSPRKV